MGELPEGAEFRNVDFHRHRNGEVSRKATCFFWEMIFAAVIPCLFPSSNHSAV
jgi:hypothetical protein